MQRKQEIIARNNERENASIKYTYTPNDKVLYKNIMDFKFSEHPWKVTYNIVTINDNGTVQV